MGIAELIRQKRIEKGLSLRDVAKYVGVSDVAVSKWEHGKIDNIRSDKLMKLSEILGISVIDLVLTDEEREARDAQRKKDQKETEDLRDMLKDNPKLRGKLDRLNELYIDGNISKSEYERRRTALEAQISTLTAVKGNVPKVFNGTWKEAYKRLDEVKKNVLWKSVVDCIIVNADKTISIKFAP